MPDVLVLLDHDGERGNTSTYELLAAARRLGDPAAGVVATPGTAARLRESLTRHGATSVHAAQATGAAGFLVTPAVDALELAVRETAEAAVLCPRVERDQLYRSASRLGDVPIGVFTADWTPVWWNTMSSAPHGDPAMLPTAERNLACADAVSQDDPASGDRRHPARASLTCCA